MYEIIDEIAKECGLIKIDKYTYHCSGDKEDLAILGIFTINKLTKLEWFTLNVEKWIWLSEKEGNSDMIKFLKQENMGVWYENKSN